jgi:Domain of unknown function (DUF4936)
MLCVYYKVDASQHALWAPRVRLMQSQLQQVWPDLVCELLQRPEQVSGVETWMETYRHAEATAPALTQAVTDAAMALGLPTPRHNERFVALA